MKNWVEGLERTSINGATENSTSTAQDSLNKFESTIQRMVEKAPKFGEIVRTASPEDRGILTDIGTLVCKAMDKLAANMKVVEVRNRKTNFQMRLNVSNVQQCITCVRVFILPVILSESTSKIR